MILAAEIREARRRDLPIVARGSGGTDSAGRIGSLVEGRQVGLLTALRNLWDRKRPAGPTGERYVTLTGPERLEPRTALSVSATLSGGVLSVVGDAGRNHIEVGFDAAQSAVVVSDFGVLAGRFDSASVQSLDVVTGAGQNTVVIDNAVLQPAIVRCGDGGDIVFAGGGPTTVLGGAGNDKIYAGSAPDLLNGGGGTNEFFEVKSTDSLVTNSRDRVFAASQPPAAPSTGDPNTVLTPGDVGQLLDRAAAATASDDAIVAVVDRGGHLLGVRVEGNVSPLVTGNLTTLTFAIDGAIAEARTGAFFSSNQAPLTSRTVEDLSQSTITQREVDSNPDLTDQNSPAYGPGLVAAVGVGGHFPPDIANQPSADLFQIELTNRDGLTVPGPNGPIALPNRFNVPSQYIPSSIPADEQLVAPVSYGVLTGLLPTAQGRGIGTLPGGIPLYKDGVLVGGIGVFFPGTTGYASAENSSMSNTHDPTKPDRSLEAEYVAFAAAGGSSGAGFPIGTLGGVPALPGFDLPFGRIDLVGITLDIYGPGGTQGPDNLVRFGQTLGVGNPNSGTNEPIDAKGSKLAGGAPVPDGWLVTPHAGGGLTADDVTRIIQQGVAQAGITRAAIRLPLGSRTRMIFAVSDEAGDILGLYRMPDATVFSLDVAVAKARNVAYYDSSAQLQPQDQVPGIPPGVSFTNRTFRYLAQPFFPEGINGQPPGPFSILNDPGVNPQNGLDVGPPLPASAYQSVLGYAAFHPSANFRDPNNLANQNGIVFFPGSSALYTLNGTQIVGGLGVSGDGVDQDDVVTYAASLGFDPAEALKADQFFFRSVRLPYQNFDRNPDD
jgi:uncharacterized protein GlcG (DUF336 family)